MGRTRKRVFATVKIKLVAGRATPARELGPQSAAHRPSGIRPAVQRRDEGPRRGDRAGRGHGLRGPFVRPDDQEPDDSLPATRGSRGGERLWLAGPQRRGLDYRGAAQEDSGGQDAGLERLIGGERDEGRGGHAAWICGWTPDQVDGASQDSAVIPRWMRVPSPGTLSTRSVAPMGPPTCYLKVARP